ncbi:MAG: L-2-hydroxyglutarate oxidase [Magnetococcales bacterium]|nr:L-2-hydroxyglutarate oxidase [Magnetococcales bacterium]
MTETTDFLIIGGGVLGLTLALEVRKRHPGMRVVVLEKERQPGTHASGRNSGVLHAGFYYTADSLKARFCREGNRELTEYCLSRKLSIRRCGKLVVARSHADLPGLAELLRRGRVNGVALEELTAREALEIEPRARTVEKALFAPTTASVDPVEVMAALVQDARQAGVEILTQRRFLGGKRIQRGESDGAVEIETSGGAMAAGYLINAAGLHADRVAHGFGFAREYAILPFKGLYLYSDEPPESLKTHIYPVPNLDNPFLGVHFTVGVGGGIKIGPTAIPAFWREHYQGFEGFRLKEMGEILSREAGLFWGNHFNFRRLAFQELGKYRKSRLARLAGELVGDVDPAHYRRWGRPGIRAQLLHLPSRRLEMDFIYQGDAHSFHLLNAVSPAFTCALPLGRFLMDRIESLMA